MSMDFGRMKPRRCKCGRACPGRALQCNRCSDSNPIVREASAMTFARSTRALYCRWAKLGAA